MDDDDLDFSDPDLDDLPANALLQLETSAFRATQHHAEKPDDTTYDSEDLEDADEVIDLNDPPAIPRFTQRQPAYARSHAVQNGSVVSESMSQTMYGDSFGQTVDGMGTTEAPGPTQVDTGKLLSRIKKLEQEKRRLNTDLQAATAEASRRAGEADNIRRRTVTENRTREQRVEAQQRMHREATDRLTLERDSLQRQLEQARTSNAFDEYNARQESNVQRTRRAVPARPKHSEAPSPAGTPSKEQRLKLLADGFDDEDMIVVSPSKRREKSKAATPRQASKRKRPVNQDSPIPTLQLSEPREKALGVEAAASPASHGQQEIAILDGLRTDDDRFQLLQRFLAHHCGVGNDRVVEALARHTFPSKPDEKLSSVLLDALSSLHQSGNSRELALRICDVFFTLWRRCLREKHFAPVALLLDAIQFLLAITPFKVAAESTDAIVTLVFDSVRLVAQPVFEAANPNATPKRVAALFSPAQQAIVADIDVEACLELLYAVATSCIAVPGPDALEGFWRAMPLDFVLLLLHRAQPLAQMKAMLHTLNTSALRTSIGPIRSGGEPEQAVMESSLITRLTNLFSETIGPFRDPSSPATNPSTTPPEDLYQIRLDVLNLLIAFAVHPGPAATLARHGLCFSRLLRYLNATISSLYTSPLHPTLQPLRIATINTAMKLIHHLATTTGVDFQAKLSAQGRHAYLLALTRLSFSEGVLLEEGIEPRVCDMAHEVLDTGGMGVEEGEGVEGVFGSGNASTG